MPHSPPERRSRPVGRIAAALRALLLGGALMAATPAAARNLALLVGVTQYDEKSIRTLEGPNNDVILMWRELKRRGFRPEDMTVIAEKLPSRADNPRPAAAPTRAAILAELKALADKAQAGDFVVFQFSGHGSTQPVADPAAQIEPEPDGRDQVLLPRDAGIYDANLKSIRNAIVDDELALALDAIRLKGATVWAVIDACHSGTVTRSAGESVTRAVRSATLGVPAGPGPATTPTSAQRSGTFVVRNAAGKAPLIGFYAVDSRAEAIERPFPNYAPGLAGRAGAERIGVFTAHLVRALGAGKASTFRDLARLVASDMAKLQGSASAPLPVFDGDLDRPISGGEVVPAVRHEGQFDDKGVTIAAGVVHGFESGAVVAIYDGPLSGKRIAKAHIAESTAATSLAKIDGDADIRFGAEVWAEVEEAAVSFTFRVARPEVPGSIDAARIGQIIDKAKDGSGRRALAIELVAPGEPADLRLTIDQGRLWAVPDGQPLITDAAQPGTSISLDLATSDNALSGALRRVIWSMARASNLVRIASAGGNDGESAVTITVDVTREGDAARLSEAKRTCAALAKPGATTKLEPAIPVSAGHCDQFSISLKNTGDREVDVGVFYLDSRAGVDLVDDRMANNGCIVTLPSAMTEPMRLPSRQFAIWEDGKPLALGMQRILVFAMPRAGSSPPSLCHLREASLEAAARTATRSAAPAKGLARLLSQAGLADGSVRSAAPTAAGDEGPAAVVRQFAFDLQLPGR